MLQEAYSTLLKIIGYNTIQSIEVKNKWLVATIISNAGSYTLRVKNA